MMVVQWLLIVSMAAYAGLHPLRAAWKTLNTDFPNYYLTARLAREGIDTSRIYEWIWLQRQKDHREIDRKMVGLVAITPFSALVMQPFAGFGPLTAKRGWLILNLALLIPIAVLLRSLTRQPWRHILIVFFLSVPLHKNFLFGQYYVLLLFILTLACWCYVRKKRLVSGLLIGVAFGLKLFPLLYLGYFLRKKDFRALTGGVLGSVGAAIASIAVFGWQTNRVFVSQVLPWALRGEGLNPYDLSSGSITTLFHRLFVYEPQWNPYPTIHAAWMFALFFPLAQTLLFAPALLLADPENNDARRLQLEWSAVLIASLAISTAPASYHFTLLILPVCLMWKAAQEKAGRAGVAVLLLLYAAIGHPGWKSLGEASRLTLFRVPRLYLIVLLCLFVYWLIATQRRNARRPVDTWLWGAAFLLLLLLNIGSELRHQNGLYADYQWRLPTAIDMLQANGPAVQNDAILFTAMSPAGYRTASQNDEDVHFDSGKVDQLAITATSAERWTEHATRESTIVADARGREPIPQAEFPVASPDGRWLAYLREDHGRASLWVRALDQSSGTDKVLTSAEFNVLEMSFLPNGSLIFSAERNREYPRLFLISQAGVVSSLNLDEARYPAISPDGRWLAYNKLQSGNWHLWLRDLRSGTTAKLTPADCNNVEPVWESDSKTLIYSSDCGRALRFTALCRHRIIE
ncbi:MAG TPA: glycosyltransferase 87 family protein [Edaphobacter sp.]|nr:glycosyltransferase 87 family protein [Edaphobacter sp.]